MKGDYPQFQKSYSHQELIEHFMLDETEQSFPISRSLTTYCVRLELRSRPSAGITRHQRYNEPLQLPGRPGLFPHGRPVGHP